MERFSSNVKKRIEQLMPIFVNLNHVLGASVSFESNCQIDSHLHALLNSLFPIQ